MSMWLVFAVFVVFVLGTIFTFLRGVSGNGVLIASCVLTIILAVLAAYGALQLKRRYDQLKKDETTSADRKPVVDSFMNGRSLFHMAHKWEMLLCWVTALCSVAVIVLNILSLTDDNYKTGGSWQTPAAVLNIVGASINVVVMLMLWMGTSPGKK